MADGGSLENCCAVYAAPRVQIPLSPPRFKNSQRTILFFIYNYIGMIYKLHNFLLSDIIIIYTLNNHQRGGYNEKAYDW